MAEAIISPIVEQLGSRAIKQLEQEVTLVFGVKKAVRKLKSNMVSIQAVIKDAEIRAQLITENAVRVWVDKLKDVSYDIDDVLDEWSTAILKVQIDRAENPSSKVCFFIPASCCMFRQIIIRRDIAVKIKDLNGRLDEIAEEKNKYSFHESLTLPTISHSSQSSTIKNRESVSFVNVQDIVGRVDDKKMLIDMLSSESSDGPNLSIISMIGMGGLGKTTLAQLAYNDETIRARFEKRMWVCVSDLFDETRIAKAILEALMGSAPNLNELTSLMQSIREHVQGKKILLVLDDVWCEKDDWCKKFQDSLEAGSHGSKILITTRKEGVANKARSEKFNLGKLTDKECWDLFKRVAFYDWNDKEREDVEAIGHQIVEKCKGLPLAVKTIGSFLCMKKLKQEWSNVLGEGKKWRVTEEEGVFPLLLLSYHDLSPALRQCFLYCGVFPKDYIIKKDDTIKLWMAQGYLGSQEMEEVGDEYFSELAMRSFFQDFKKSDGGTIENCKMHDIVHDFARSLTNNECLAMEFNGVEEPNLETSSYANTRHLMMMFGRCAISIPISLGNLKSLRTLIFSHDNRLWGATMSTSFDESFDKVIDQLTSLRTLDLSETKIEKLPRKIGKLLHLRYLNLKGCEKLKELPQTVWDLCNLLILDVSGCRSLERLPGGLGKVINLRQLKLEYSGIRYIPRGVDRLTSLCYLDEFVVSSETIDKNEVSTLSDLMNLNQLRGKLGISWLGDVREASEAKKANLNKKEHLTELYLSFGSRAQGEEMEERRDVEVLEALQPHPNLQSLDIERYRGRMAWPSWMTSSLINLKRLNLYFCDNCEVLPTLGKLPSLESLEISDMISVKRVGSELLGTSTSSASPTVFFPKLKSLEFKDMWEWEEWDYTIFTQDEEEEESSDISTTSAIISIMPCLQYLEIYKCPKLKRVPDYILNTPSLKTFTITWSRVLKEHMMKYFPDDSRLRWE